ncbi:MAG: DUF5011 domain-containing protein [Candidatus Pacebacteria bacterium]|nr:DUF5011 domain-containing protein [Candidatus Paceibacterota bacterium]
MYRMWALALLLVAPSSAFALSIPQITSIDDASGAVFFQTNYINSANATFGLSANVTADESSVITIIATDGTLSTTFGGTGAYTVSSLGTLSINAGDLSSLSDGDVQVIARASRSGETVDSLPVTMTKDTVVTVALSSGIAEGGATGDTTPTFAWTAEDGATFTCAVDGGIPVVCTSPYTLPLLSDGAHTFTVTTTDLAGNTRTLTRSFTVDSLLDAVAPTLTSVTMQSNFTTTSRARTGDRITLNMRADETIATPVVTILGHSVTPSTFSDPAFYFATYDVVAEDAEGVVTFTISAQDTSGNVAETVSATTDSSAVRIDRTAPVLTLTGDNPLTLDRDGVFSDPGATALDESDGTLVVTESGEVSMGAAGTYTRTYSATDLSGNQGTITRTVEVLGPVQSTGGGGGGGSHPKSAKRKGEVLGATTYLFTRELQRGDSGQDVTELQNVLIAGGYLESEPTGFFGPLTETGVMLYQSANGLPAVGRVGPQTLALLNQSLGMSKEAVLAQLYATLNELLIELEKAKKAQS